MALLLLAAAATAQPPPQQPLQWSGVLGTMNGPRSYFNRAEVVGMPGFQDPAAVVAAMPMQYSAAPNSPPQDPMWERERATTVTYKQLVEEGNVEPTTLQTQVPKKAPEYPPFYNFPLPTIPPKPQVLNMAALSYPPPYPVGQAGQMAQYHPSLSSNLVLPPLLPSMQQQQFEQMQATANLQAQNIGKMFPYTQPFNMLPAYYQPSTQAVSAVYPAPSADWSLQQANIADLNIIPSSHSKPAAGRPLAPNSPHVQQKSHTPTWGENRHTPGAANGAGSGAQSRLQMLEQQLGHQLLQSGAISMSDVLDNSTSLQDMLSSTEPVSLPSALDLPVLPSPQAHTRRVPVRPTPAKGEAFTMGDEHTGVTVGPRARGTTALASGSSYAANANIDPPKKSPEEEETDAKDEAKDAVKNARRDAERMLTDMTVMQQETTRSLRTFIDDATREALDASREARMGIQEGLQAASRATGDADDSVDDAQLGGTRIPGEQSSSINNPLTAAKGDQMLKNAKKVHDEKTKEMKRKMKEKAIQHKMEDKFTSIQDKMQSKMKRLNSKWKHFNMVDKTKHMWDRLPKYKDGSEPPKDDWADDDPEDDADEDAAD